MSQGNRKIKDILVEDDSSAGRASALMIGALSEIKHCKPGDLMPFLLSHLYSGTDTL